MTQVTSERLSVLEYGRINDSWQRWYLHRFRYQVGFGADFLGLLAAAAWCWENQVSLRVQYVADRRGWPEKTGYPDYFSVPLREYRVPLLGRLNHATPKIYLRGPLRSIVSSILRRVTGAQRVLAAGLPRPSAKFVFPGVDTSHHDTYWASMASLARILFTFNDQTREEVDTIIDSLHFPISYNAIHVRRGDKNSEFDYVALDTYVELVASIGLSQGDDILIFSDDGQCADDLASLLRGRGYNAKSVSDGGGHSQAAFNREKDLGRRRGRMVRLLAELEAMSNASTFIGTSTSNVFYVVGYLRGADGCHDVSRGGWLPPKESR